MRVVTGLFLAFVLVTAIEIVLFIYVGGAIGSLPTVLLVLLTALAGSYLVRQQGMRAWRSAQAKLSAGEAPTNELFDGLAILFAGGVLFTPGFLTDVLGLALMMPLVRRWLQNTLFRHFSLHNAWNRSTQSKTINAEYYDVDDRR